MFSRPPFLGPTSTPQAWTLAQHPLLKRGCSSVDIHPSSVDVGTSTPQVWTLTQHPALKPSSMDVGPTSTPQVWTLAQHPPLKRSNVDVGPTSTPQAWLLAQHPPLKRGGPTSTPHSWMLPLERGCWPNIHPSPGQDRNLLDVAPPSSGSMGEHIYFKP